ncbi:hypothetical protein GWK47_053382 [Chionoecetes opilio]|uniref:Uncharacterized protein n=1 Tax=Chionoecetes opilio TaxID=41210 RepID=A0A8J4Y0M4_CHIOP|nr:hypothetical protein GWK47_053382 [Chionoecetes opilio]
MLLCSFPECVNRKNLSQYNITNKEGRLSGFAYTKPASDWAKTLWPPLTSARQRSPVYNEEVIAESCRQRPSQKPMWYHTARLMSTLRPIFTLCRSTSLVLGVDIIIVDVKHHIASNQIEECTSHLSDEPVQAVPFTAGGLSQLGILALSLQWHLHFEFCDQCDRKLKDLRDRPVARNQWEWRCPSALDIETCVDLPTSFSPTNN